jgi:hypothetical protein
MPTIYDYLGLVFYFYSNEHNPIHVHVAKGGRETIYELIVYNSVLTEIKRRKRRGKDFLTASDDKKAVEFINEKYNEIIDKWADFFIRKITPKIVKITKKR